MLEKAPSEWLVGAKRSTMFMPIATKMHPFRIEFFFICVVCHVLEQLEAASSDTILARWLQLRIPRSRHGANDPLCIFDCTCMYMYIFVVHE